MGVKYSCSQMGNFSIGKQGHKLIPTEEGVLYWSINNFTPDMEKYEVILAVQKAFDVWNKVLHPIRFESIKEWQKAHIRISFASKDHDGFFNGHYPLKCPVKFDGEGGVLAHAYFADPELHMDEDEDWTGVEGSGGVHLLTVLIHEIGHNLNIGHSSVKAAIMYPEYNGPKTELHPDDIAAVYRLYELDRRRVAKKMGIQYYVAEKPGFFQRILNWFK